MKKVALSYPKAFAASVMVHVVIFCLLLLNPAPTPQEFTLSKAEQSKPIIEAVSIDEKMVMQQVHQRRQEQLQQKIAEQKRQQQQQRLEQRLQTQIQQAKLEQKKAAQQLQTIQQQIASQRHSAKQQKQQLDNIKKQSAQAQQSLQATQQKLKNNQERARELARLRVRREAAEKRAKAEAEMRELKLKKNRGEIDRYAVMIKQAIGRRWIFPNEANKTISCRFQVQLAPSGDVLDVKLLAASGNSVLDRAAKLAIYKASPLPVPSDPDLFLKFKTFNITMRPEKVIATI